MTSLVRRLGAATAVLSLVLVGAACGGDEDNDGGEDPHPTSSIVASTSSTFAATDGAEPVGDCSDEEIVTTSADFFADAGTDPANPPSIIGLGDVNGDDEAELWAQVGTGASATILGLALREGCDLERVTFESGDPATFAVGGSVGISSGVACESTLEPDADLTAFTLSNIGGDEYELTTTEYELQGSELVQVGSDAANVSASDPDFGHYSGFNCGDLTAG